MRGSSFARIPLLTSWIPPSPTALSASSISASRLTARTIVVAGGLADLSATRTTLERGGSALPVSSRLGGHATLAHASRPVWAITSALMKTLAGHADEPDAYAANSSPTGLLARHRLDLLALGTTGCDDAPWTSSLPPLPPPLCATSRKSSPLTPARRQTRASRVARAEPSSTQFVREVDGEVLCRDGGGAGHCGPGFRRAYPDTAAFAGDTGIPLENLLSTFASYGKEDKMFATVATTKSYRTPNPLCLAIITPVMHYTRSPSPSTPLRARSPPSPTEEVIARTGTRRIGSRGRRVVVARGGRVWHGSGAVAS
ncbi:hypothetical protein C8R45DRAFT_1221397 [Mycena sanguinolenta]|nr:hypothetical protein C8R45DRAFT_1221397 [Mycena sanguinolenta]